MRGDSVVCGEGVWVVTCAVAVVGRGVVEGSSRPAGEAPAFASRQRGSASAQMSIEELLHERRHLVERRLQEEVAAVE